MITLSVCLSVHRYFDTVLTQRHNTTITSILWKPLFLLTFESMLITVVRLLVQELITAALAESMVNALEDISHVEVAADKAVQASTKAECDNHR